MELKFGNRIGTVDMRLLEALAASTMSPGVQRAITVQSCAGQIKAIVSIRIQPHSEGGAVIVLEVEN